MFDQQAPQLPMVEDTTGGPTLLDGRLVSEPTAADRAVVARILALEAAQRADDEVVSHLPAESAGAVLAHQSRLGRLVFGSEVLARAGFAQGLRLVYQLVTSVLDHDRAVYGCERSQAMEFAVHEVAASLGVNRRTADVRVQDAMLMVPDHPRTLAVLEAGYLPVAAARELAHRLVGEPAALRAAVEARVLDTLGRPADLLLGSGDLDDLALTARLEPDRAMTVSLGASRGRVRDLTRRALRDLRREFPDALPSPSESAPQSTTDGPDSAGDVEAWPSRRPGYVGVGADVTEADATVILDRLDLLARSSKRRGDPRSLADLRVAWYVTLLTSERDGAPDLPAALGLAPVPVDLTVHLLDQRTAVDAAQLGPITPETLTALLNAATTTGGTIRTRRVAMPTCPGHPVDTTGAVLDPGPYVVPPKLREAIQARDRTCRFPGCMVPARSCDLDHSLPHPRGPTCQCNLCCLCRRHHRLKTSGRWQLINHGDGAITWTSPTGQTYTVLPDPP